MTSLNLQTLASLTEIWEEKKWTFLSQELRQKSFDAFCEMFCHIGDEYHEIALALMKSFSVYAFNDYLNLLNLSFGKINENHIKDYKCIIFCPLLNPSDDKRKVAKSGHSLPYIAKQGVALYHPLMSELDLNCLISPSQIPDEIKFKYHDKPILIILLDDFIGSGDTAKNAVYGVSDLIRKDDQILVVSLVAMRHAIEYLADNGIDAIYGTLEKKGILENDRFDDKESAYKMMKSLENNLMISQDERLGYKKSEALITMLRTPDNTFPIYWCTESVGGVSWPAPFPRLRK